MATVIIKAKSLAEARKKAEEIQSNEANDWNPTDNDVWVDDVQELRGGQDND